MVENQVDELEIIVKEVLRKRDRIIPVIGDDSFVGTINVGGKECCFPLQRWIAEKLLGNNPNVRFSTETIYKEGYRGLDMLYEEYIRVNPDEGFLEYQEAIVSTIECGLRNNTVALRKDVKDFLLAGKFEVIATTCPYHILEEIISIDNRKYNVSSFSPLSTKLSTNSTSKSEEKITVPSIYQLFGDCDGEFVSGEEDLLKFLHYLNQANAERGFGASPLVKYIKDKGQDSKGMGLLMPIGCNNLPNWLFRFLWYPFSYDCLIGSDKRNQGGVWCKYSDDESFYKFLRKYRFKTFSGPTDILKGDDSDGDPVLERLTKEFKNSADAVRHYISDILHIPSSDDGNWDIFISYATEDEHLAKKVYDILTVGCGKKVWMATYGGITVGDAYWDAIQYGIEHSQRFLFLITESYLLKAKEKNHKYETGIIEPSGVYQEIDLIIQQLIDKKRDGKKGFSIPIIRNGTRVTYTDYDGNLHKDEILQSGVLEKLPKYEEYQVMQTDKLFYQIQDCIFEEDTLERTLHSIFD